MSRRPALLVTVLLAAAATTGAAPSVAETTGVREGVDPVVEKLLSESLEATRVAPEDPAAWKRLCLAYEANLLWPEAAECFRRLAGLQPDVEVWGLHEAVARIEVGEVEAARRILRSLADGATRLPAVHERLGYLELEGGALEAAGESFARLIALAPSRAAGYVGAGEVDLLAGRPEEAIGRLERALELEPSHRSARYQLGLAYRAAGRREEAERALAMGSGAERRFLPSPLAAEVAELSVHLAAGIDRAGALLEEGRPAEAAELLEAERRRWPENTTLMNDLAIAYLHLDRLDEARRLLDGALAIEPDGFATHLNLSAWARYAGRDEESLAHARRAVEAAPGVAATHLALAQALTAPGLRQTPAERAEHHTDMLASIERAIEIGVEEPDAYLQLARGRWRRGEVEPALEVLREALDTWPDFWPAEMMSAWILVRSERYEEGAALVERLARVVPDHPDLAELERMIREAEPGSGG